MTTLVPGGTAGVAVEGGGAFMLPGPCSCSRSCLLVPRSRSLDLLALVHAPSALIPAPPALVRTPQPLVHTRSTSRALGLCLFALVCASCCCLCCGCRCAYARPRAGPWFVCAHPTHVSSVCSSLPVKAKLVFVKRNLYLPLHLTQDTYKTIEYLVF